MLCTVLRPFQATNDEFLTPGPDDAPCIVETAGWHEANVLRLIQRRYLRPIMASSSASAIPSHLSDAGEEHALSSDIHDDDALDVMDVSIEDAEAIERDVMDAATAQASPTDIPSRASPVAKRFLPRSRKPSLPRHKGKSTA